jgi:hypothetical protein
LEKKHEGQRLAVAELVAKCFAMIMVVLYIGFGTTIIFKAQQMPGIPSQYAMPLGGFLILYGVLRAYKLYRRYYSNSEE